MNQSSKCADAPVPQQQSAQYWEDLATQRGLLLRDMMDKWAERRMEFVKAKRAMGQKLLESQARERTLTRRVLDLERALLIVLRLIQGKEPAETRIAGMYPYVKQVICAHNETGAIIDEATRGGSAGAQQE